MAYNTDVPALTEEIQRFVSVPSHALVLGSGGAALASVVAARRAGAQRIGVMARRWRSADRTPWSGSEAFARLGAELWPWPDPEAGFSTSFLTFCQKVNVVVQATSAGMHGADSGDSLTECVPWSALPEGALAYDLVYNPPDTAFLRAARGFGFIGSNGLSMLVRQAALAIEVWVGQKPSHEPLYAAAERALLESRTRSERP